MATVKGGLQGRGDREKAGLKAGAGRRRYEGEGGKNAGRDAGTTK